MARPRLVTTLAAAVLAAPLVLVAAADDAEASAGRYTVTQKWTWGGTAGSRMTLCGPADFAVSHRIISKSGPAKIRSVTFYSQRTGNYTHPEGMENWEGMIVEWRDGRNRPGSVTVQLVCEPD